MRLEVSPGVTYCTEFALSAVTYSFNCSRAIAFRYPIIHG